MKIIKVIFVLSVIFIVTYYLLDRKLFYYGKSDFKFYNLLPLKIVPDYTAKWEYGFTLRDEYGFSIAAKGNSYPFNGRTVFINKVFKYGFNSSQLVAIVSDSSHVIYCLKFAPTPNDRTDFNAIMYSGDKISDFKLNRWVDIDDNYIGRLEPFRNWAMFISIILILILFYKSVQLIKNIIQTKTPPGFPRLGG